jgi:hypothetical protein
MYLTNMLVAFDVVDECEPMCSTWNVLNHCVLMQCECLLMNWKECALYECCVHSI